ncbi:hypothetical protein GCM10020001_027690 [Nonomuraea salmonea]
MKILDPPAVRRWARLAADALGQARTEIDALNVFPVADGDTGTNLHLTMLSAAEAVESLPEDVDAAVVWQTLSYGALMGGARQLGGDRQPGAARPRRGAEGRLRPAGGAAQSGRARQGGGGQAGRGHGAQRAGVGGAGRPGGGGRPARSGAAGGGRGAGGARPYA